LIKEFRWSPDGTIGIIVTIQFHQKIVGMGSKEFIRIEKFLENATPTKSHVMIMEAGVADVKVACALNGPLRGSNLLRVTKAMANAVAVIHGR
jgi:hypothetical protein